MNIYELLNKGVLETVEVIIKQGKESVVLAGKEPSGNWVAIKVYRTLACDYKNMWKYLVGDPRIKKLKKDRWSIVAAWCQKEFKNLKVAHEAKVSCPEPKAFRENVLVMEFIGENSVPAPRLVDIKVPNPKRVYSLIMKDLEKLIKAGLIHGDASAFNILFYKKPYLIDFSQSVMLKHPLALELLKRDIKNVNDYFSKLGVSVKDNEEVYKNLVRFFSGS
jgi:RIO kinase 1